MATTATTKGATSAGTKPNAGKSGAWVRQHKLMVVLGVVAIVALWMLTRRSAGSAAASTSQDPYGLAGMPQGPTATDPYGGSGLTDPNSLAGLMSQLLAGQAGLGDQLNALAANPGEASTTTAKGGGNHAKSGHAKNAHAKNSGHKSDGHGGTHKPVKKATPKPKLNAWHPFTGPAAKKSAVKTGKTAPRAAKQTPRQQMARARITQQPRRK